MIGNMLETKLAYSEVYEILSLLDNEYRNKVPKNVIDFFEEERMKEYKPEINLNLSLTEQNLKKKTITLLAILNLNYWCENEKEKEKFKNELIKNEKEKKELEEKYNPSNLFKKNNDSKEIEGITENETALVKYDKEGFIKKILNKVKKIFKR